MTPLTPPQAARERLATAGTIDPGPGVPPGPMIVPTPEVAPTPTTPEPEVPQHLPPGILPETPHAPGPLPGEVPQPIHEPVPYEIPGPVPQPIHEPVV